MRVYPHERALIDSVNPDSSAMAMNPIRST
jgi:hypothetical protein